MTFNRTCILFHFNFYIYILILILFFIYVSICLTFQINLLFIIIIIILNKISLRNQWQSSAAILVFIKDDREFLLSVFLLGQANLSVQAFLRNWNIGREK